jgi:hypothetical protein
VMCVEGGQYFALPGTHFLPLLLLHPTISQNDRDFTYL